MKILDSIGALNDWRNLQSQDVLFVPTMGALHEGHLSLVRAAQELGTRVVVSIFVNPTQFSEDEDLDTYPKTLDEDIQKLKTEGVEALWLPSVHDIYPNGPEVDVRLRGITKILEGEHRPHFFDGVATVVKRLFDLLKPDYAFLGEKDFQQLQVIRELVRVYNMPIEIVGAPIARDSKGLALSSRNSYLSDGELEAARMLNKVMTEFAESDLSEGDAKERLMAHGFDKVDYITKRNSQTFNVENPDRVLVAAWIGKTRLIDNMSFLHSE